MLFENVDIVAKYFSNIFIMVQKYFRVFCSCREAVNYLGFYCHRTVAELKFS
jgi:hypothetical protein